MAQLRFARGGILQDAHYSFSRALRRSRRSSKPAIRLVEAQHLIRFVNEKDFVAIELSECRAVEEVATLAGEAEISNRIRRNLVALSLTRRCGNGCKGSVEPLSLRENPISSAAFMMVAMVT